MIRRRVLVVGAQGVLGHFVAQALRAAGWDVLRAGRRPQAGAGFLRVDLNAPDGLADACAGADLVVNTVPHPGLVVERTVLRHGGVLLDLAAVDRGGTEALVAAADSAAEGLVLVHAGLVPGAATLAAASLVAEHPEADAVEVGFNFSTASTSGPAGAAFAYRVLTSRPRHPVVQLSLPPPFGRMRGLDVGMHGEGWLAGVAGARSTHFVVGITERLAHLGLLVANRLGFMNRLPQSLFVQKARPLPPTPSREPVCVWVAVRQGERVLGAWTIEGAGDYACTVAATLVFAEALRAVHAGDPARVGVVGPEELFAFEDLRPAFEARGLVLTRS